MEPKIVLLPQENIDRLATAIGKQVAVEILNSIDRLLLEEPTSPFAESMLYLVGIAREERARKAKKQKRDESEKRFFDNQKRIPEQMPVHIRYEIHRRAVEGVVCPGCQSSLPLPELAETADFSNIPISCPCTSGKMIYDFLNNTLRKTK